MKHEEIRKTAFESMLTMAAYRHNPTVGAYYSPLELTVSSWEDENDQDPEKDVFDSEVSTLCNLWEARFGVGEVPLSSFLERSFSADYQAFWMCVARRLVLENKLYMHIEKQTLSIAGPGIKI